MKKEIILETLQYAINQFDITDIAYPGLNLAYKIVESLKDADVKETTSPMWKNNSDTKSIKLNDDLTIVEKKNDKKVNHPAYYQGKRECIETMRKLFGDDAVAGFCKCNAYKYRFRAGNKDNNSMEQDLSKAEWYEDYLFKMDGETK